MRALSIVPCVLFLGIAQATAAGEDAVPTPLNPPVELYLSGCADLPAAEQAYCVGREMSRYLPCSGSVEERLTCLEKRVLDQQREIVALRRAVDDLNAPRVRPLTQDRDRPVR